MKGILNSSHVVPGTVAALLAGLCFTFCATDTGTRGASKPGHGVAEYRRLALGAREAVEAMVRAMEALTHISDPAAQPALDRFDRALHRLEVVSVTTRARAEAIRARGAAYFEEWKEGLPPPDTDAGRAMAEESIRLRRQFDLVRAASDAAREEFKPFMPALRNLRETLETSPNPAAAEASRQELAGATANGRRLLQALSRVLETLDSAATELHAATRPVFAP